MYELNFPSSDERLRISLHILSLLGEVSEKTIPTSELFSEALPAREFPTKVQIDCFTEDPYVFLSIGSIFF